MHGKHLLVKHAALFFFLFDVSVILIDSLNLPLWEKNIQLVIPSQLSSLLETRKKAELRQAGSTNYDLTHSITGGVCVCDRGCCRTFTQL